MHIFRHIILACIAATLLLPGLARAKAYPANQIQRTVNGPYPDTFLPTVPKPFAKDPLGAKGFVDVTCPLFQADPTGQKDATKAIQNAVNFARNNQMICYFPLGTYLVSGTIECIQNVYRRTNGELADGRFYPVVLLGERGPNKEHPLIKLAPRSKGFNNPGDPKPVFHFWSRSMPRNGKIKKPAQPNIAMNQKLCSLDIEIGGGNGGAVGVRLQGAQGSGVQDSVMHINGGYAGIQGGCGSGGGHHKVTIFGGEIGLEMEHSENAPTVSGATLIGQRKHAIVYYSAQTLTIVGSRIMSKTGGVAIQGADHPRSAHYGQMCIVDTEIIFQGRPGTVVDTANSLYLQNVYALNAEAWITSRGKKYVSATPGIWQRLDEYALGIPPQPFDGKWRYAANIYLDGGIKGTIIPVMDDHAQPPNNLYTRHTWPDDFPFPLSDAFVDVKQLGAKGDGRTDDTKALQKAITENKFVFLPKGIYKISRTLKLRPDSAIIGAGQHIAMIVPFDKKGDFTSREEPKPLMQTSDNADASTTLASFCLSVPREINTAYALLWQCGGDSILRDVNFLSKPLRGHAKPGKALSKKTPMVVITGNGAGKWWNFYQESSRNQWRGYAHLAITGAKGPLRFYQLNPEHALSRHNLLIEDSQDIIIYSLKSEGNMPVLVANNSRNFQVIGYGGNGAADPGKALFVINKCTDFLLANLVDSPKVKKRNKTVTGYGVPPDQWHMILDSPAKGRRIKLTPQDRPVLYKRGQPFPARAH